MSLSCASTVRKAAVLILAKFNIEERQRTFGSFYRFVGHLARRLWVFFIRMLVMGELMVLRPLLEGTRRLNLGRIYLQ
jgi:hypothetical protein